MNLREWLHAVITENDKATRLAFSDWIEDECPELMPTIPYLREDKKYVLTVTGCLGQQTEQGGIATFFSMRNGFLPDSVGLTWDQTVAQLRNMPLIAPQEILIEKLIICEKLKVCSEWITRQDDPGYFFSTDYVVREAVFKSMSNHWLPRLISYLMYATAFPDDRNIERPLPRNS